MGMCHREVWYLACDAKGCDFVDDEDPAETELSAERRAKSAGFVKIDGLWFCEEHNPNKKPEDEDDA